MSTVLPLDPPTAGSPPPPPPNPRTQQMLHGPLLPTLLRLATPNVIGLFATTLVIGYDGYILGRLGAEALAGIALVFPLSMLMLQMSAGGIGGATTAAVARALGAGRGDDAGRLAQQALFIAGALAVAFMAVLLGFGRGVFGAMGGRGAALDAAMAYATVLFGGAAVIWWTNVLAAIVRGSGNMLLPSLMLMATALVHVLLCPLLVFGWGPVPGLGVAGAAWSTLATNALAAAVMAAHLLRRDGAVHLNRAPWRLHGGLLRDILRVGAPASLSPVLSNASIAAATAFVGSFGTAALAGYGVAARLEYILVPIAFGFGTALTAMVATNMGAGQTPRALRVAWIGGGLVAAITGSIGAVAALWPALWMDLFTADAAVRAVGGSYLRIVGGFYGLFGLGLALFFASQGAGRMAWPLAGSLARLLVVAGGGWLCVSVLHGSAEGFFAVVAFSMLVYGGTIAGAIRLGSWTRRSNDIKP
ncbi:MATE family efflux transporter [Ideonella sp. A 288]|uniref:MATE family efflux transporter n=1 Tax=Ideonella sp. A 288 TaxID=1962181 RepID=UPI0013035DDF|nr:MATE family efflux transporter [Ideonella sp. A 288]